MAYKIKKLKKITQGVELDRQERFKDRVQALLREDVQERSGHKGG